jgi:uncharacterized protein YndB with AHSA1/START domain
MPSTFRLYRAIPAKLGKVYRAFVEADALAKWRPPSGFTCTVHHLEAKVDCTVEMSFRNFTTGGSDSFGGKYLEPEPGKRQRYTDAFDDPSLPSELFVTAEPKGVSVGTEMTIVQENIPEAIPPEACYLGSQESPRNLARLVEPEIRQ